MSKESAAEYAEYHEDLPPRPRRLFTCDYCGLGIYEGTEWAVLGANGEYHLHGDCYTEHQDFIDEVCR